MKFDSKPAEFLTNRHQPTPYDPCALFFHTIAVGAVSTPLFPPPVSHVMPSV
jgi:hypothetical protein